MMTEPRLTPNAFARFLKNSQGRCHLMIGHQLFADQLEHSHQWMLKVWNQYSGLNSARDILQVNHCDYLFLDIEEGKSQHTLQNPQWNELKSALLYPPKKNQHLFVIINQAHKLGKTLSNKWLKNFEEPPSWCHIFLLIPASYQLLPTLESRCLKWRIPSAEMASERFSSPTISNFSQLKELNKRNSDGRNQWISTALCQFSHEEKMNSKNIDRLLESIKQLKRSEKFNSTTDSALYNLFNSLKA